MGTHTRADDILAEEAMKAALSTVEGMEVNPGYRAIAEEAAKRAIKVMQDEGICMEDYSAALDEIYMLRRAMAYEADVLEVHLDYKTFPKTRRKIAEDSVKRMRAAARGWGGHSWAGTSYLSLRSAFKKAGARETLTRHDWEKDRGKEGFYAMDLTDD